MRIKINLAKVVIVYLSQFVAGGIFLLHYALKNSLSFDPELARAIVIEKIKSTSGQRLI